MVWREPPSELANRIDIDDLILIEAYSRLETYDPEGWGQSGLMWATYVNAHTRKGFTVTPRDGMPLPPRNVTPKELIGKLDILAARFGMEVEEVEDR